MRIYTEDAEKTKKILIFSLYLERLIYVYLIREYYYVFS